MYWVSFMGNTGEAAGRSLSGVHSLTLSSLLKQEAKQWYFFKHRHLLEPVIASSVSVDYGHGGLCFETIMALHLSTNQNNLPHRGTCSPSAKVKMVVGSSRVH